MTCEDNGLCVVLDTNLDEALIEEGFVREIISKVQTQRKEAGFEVMDRIKVYLKGSAELERIATANKDMIGSVCLADEIITGSTAGYTKDWNLNGEDASLGVEKI